MSYVVEYLIILVWIDHTVIFMWLTYYGPLINARRKKEQNTAPYRIVTWNFNNPRERHATTRAARNRTRTPTLSREVEHQCAGRRKPIHSFGVWMICFRSTPPPSSFCRNFSPNSDLTRYLTINNHIFLKKFNQQKF